MKINLGLTYLVLTEMVVPKATIEPTVSNHILVVDRSGSMYGDIQALKQTLEQSLAVESFGNEKVRTTLISFSSEGDCTVHWADVQAKDIPDLTKPYIKEIRNLQATCLTGMSQALVKALGYIKPGETTGITIFTDGYANDPSPTTEKRRIDDFIKQAKAKSGVFVNAVGYRDWCDWGLLNTITNALSGKTVKARSFKDVLAVMRDTQALLASGCQPSITIKAPQPNQMLFAVMGDTVVADIGSLTLSGLNDKSNPKVYVVEEVVSPSKSILVVPENERWLYAALTMGYLGLSDLRKAKSVLFASGNKTLYAEHRTAITPSSIASCISDLRAWVVAKNESAYEMGKNSKPKHSMQDLVNVLCQLPQNSVALDLDTFWKGYTRRSVKSLLGTRNPDGSITPPNVIGEESGPCYVKGATWSGTEATLNLNTVRHLQLKKLDGTPIDMESHVDLTQLSSYRDYTLLSSGEWVVQELPLQILTKAAWGMISPFLPPLAKNKTFNVGNVYTIRLKDFGIAAEETPDIDKIAVAWKQVQSSLVRQKLLNGMKTADTNVTYTAAQIQALAALHVTVGGAKPYFSPPTTVPYTNRDAAIAAGEIDTYTRVRVRVGSVDLLHSGKLPSGNEMLKRFTSVTVPGVAKADPNLTMYWTPGAVFSAKPLSARSTRTAVDDVVEKEVHQLVLAAKRMSPEGEFNTALREASALVDDFEGMIQPLIAEVGCTGMMPDGLVGSYEQLDADAFAKKYPVKLSKAELEGTFFVFRNGDLVISVFPEAQDYSPKKS